MEILIGTGNYGRRTRIVAEEEKALNDPTVDCCGRDAADCNCRVLVTRTLVVKQLVPTTAYEPSSVKAAREYELNLPQSEQVELILQALGEDGVQIEFAVRVDQADPNFQFGQ